jgi:hypothetical protein
MRSFASSIAIAALAIALAVSTSGATVATRTWVSHSGSSTNLTASPPCNPQAPCDTFATATSATAPGGVISCLDNGSFGPVTPFQNVTIDCSGQTAGIDVSGVTNGVTVNTTNIVVTLRNLSINGNGGTGSGVSISNAAGVTIENCVIQGFTGQNGTGIFVQTSNAVQVNVTDTLIAGNVSGVFISPTGSGATEFIFERVRVAKNVGGGILVEGDSSTGAITGVVRDSVLTGSPAYGILADSTINTSPVTVSLDHTVVGNNGTGVISAGGAAVILNNSTVQVNNTGLFTNTGGAIFSYGNSAINGNQPNGSAAPILIGLH